MCFASKVLDSRARAREFSGKASESCTCVLLSAMAATSIRSPLSDAGRAAGVAGRFRFEPAAERKKMSNSIRAPPVSLWLSVVVGHLLVRPDSGFGQPGTYSSSLIGAANASRHSSASRRQLKQTAA